MCVCGVCVCVCVCACACVCVCVCVCVSHLCGTDPLIPPRACMSQNSLSAFLYQLPSTLDLTQPYRSAMLQLHGLLVKLKAAEEAETLSLKYIHVKPQAP